MPRLERGGAIRAGANPATSTNYPDSFTKDHFPFAFGSFQPLR
jgi:hypothetical protein